MPLESFALSGHDVTDLFSSDSGESRPVAPVCVYLDLRDEYVKDLGIRIIPVTIEYDTGMSMKVIFSHRSAAHVMLCKTPPLA